MFHQGSPEGYLSVRQAMVAYRCSEATVRRWLQQRLVKAVTYRRRVFILAEDLRRLDAVRPYRRQASKRSYASLVRAGAPETEPAGHMEARP
jgi:hypothetical protein